MKSFWFVALLSVVIAGLFVYFYGGNSKQEFFTTFTTQVQNVISILSKSSRVDYVVSRDYKNISIKGVAIKAEVVTTPADREKGLMHRDSLEENTGMLFVFPLADYHEFWMKNTLIPLDIIWFDNNQKIVYIEKNVQPCKTIKCPNYKPSKPAKYVLEMAGGWADAHNIFVGDPGNLNY